MKRLTASLLSRFRTSERGAILVEVLLVFPVITLFAIGMLEFGYIFWERQQMQAGVRDAARYWSRCNLAAKTSGSCSITKAKDIALTYYDPVAATTYSRLQGWTLTDTNAVVITPAVPPAVPVSTDLVTVTGTLQHNSSPLFVLLNLPPIPISYTYTMRYIGW